MTKLYDSDRKYTNEVNVFEFGCCDLDQCTEIDDSLLCLCVVWQLKNTGSWVLRRKEYKGGVLLEGEKEMTVCF